MGKKRRRAKQGVDSAPANARPLSVHQQSLVEKLASSRFRQLNETLYTSSSNSALQMVKSEPGLFAAYHTGYAMQARKWPMNPLDSVIEHLNKTIDTSKAKRPRLKNQGGGGAPRGSENPSTSKIAIADFGCGEARLAQELQQDGVEVHSFDLEAANETVVACDMAHVPLPGHSVEVAVFCLSLMGTNQTDFLKEANRVLSVGGQCIVVEVASRFAAIEGGARAWGKSVAARFGWNQTALRDLGGSYFVLFVFKTTKSGKGGKSSTKVPHLAPCIYKKR